MGPNQEFKNELDLLIDHHLLPCGDDVLLRHDRAVALETVRILEQAGPADWERPTPCARWNLRALVSHMAGQNVGFAAAADGDGADPRHWQPLPLGDGDSPVAAYRTTVGLVLASFARAGTAARRFDLPEISVSRRFPATVAIGFHFLDYAVHAWDLARAIGLDWRPDDEIAEAALALARLVPDDGRRLEPGAAFSPARTGGADPARPFDLVLTTLGRSPGWTP
ncbi:TIGR03086 family metal-binding protein [Streptomyces sp. NPDC058653]|uniref:TIGR03086 family metal-binding protein n=1 Tax=Streptomyces sp. NPDC058653 TaxID=3346576 RepID=UPI0036684515